MGIFVVKVLRIHGERRAKQLAAPPTRQIKRQAPADAARLRLFAAVADVRIGGLVIYGRQGVR